MKWAITGRVLQIEFTVADFRESSAACNQGSMWYHSFNAIYKIQSANIETKALEQMFLLQFKDWMIVQIWNDNRLLNIESISSMKTDREIFFTTSFNYS